MDIRGQIFFSAHYKWLELKAVIFTIYIKVLCFLKGITIHKGCKFYGLTLFLRHPYSSIIIKNDSRFRSSANSNLIGISKACTISTHSKDAKIVIGKRCGFSGTSIMALKSITIGDDVLTGANTVITDCDWHNINPAKRHMYVETGKPVIIEDNVFIGYAVTILKGVTIGKNSVIGANSVVSTNIPANCIAVGNPCKVVSQISF